MNVREFTRTRGTRTALAAVCVAVVMNVWALVRAFRVAPTEPPASTAVASLQGVARVPQRAPTNVASAVENDPFSPDRSAPQARYRMPGESEPAATVAEPQKPVVLGTAVATDGHSFATVQLGNGRPTLVRVGAVIGEWRVTGIGRGKIALVSTGGTRVDITVPKPGT
jgi:hypothetical protein